MVTLKEKIPQVGSKRYNFEIKDDTIICSFENEIVDYVVLLDNTLHIGIGHYKLSNKTDNLNHAGRLMITDKKISYLDNDSGHYIPTESDLKESIKYFTDLNLLSNNFKFDLK